jgi:hypothetical protein
MTVWRSTMSAEPLRETTVEAILDDPYDGAIRILGDMQRFGFELRSMALATRVDGAMSLTATFGVPVTADVQLIAARLARHPAVRHAEVAWAGGDKATFDQVRVVAA